MACRAAGSDTARSARRRHRADTDDGPFPDHGDLVDHFAFGSCEVLKGDGDRIHVKVGKDGRIREIALEMLKVTLKSEPDERPRRFRLERKL